MAKLNIIACGRVPLQYLTGATHWRDLVVAVGRGVLIPRPETELLIDFVQEVAFAFVKGQNMLQLHVSALSICFQQSMDNERV